MNDQLETPITGCSFKDLAAKVMIYWKKLSPVKPLCRLPGAYLLTKHSFLARKLLNGPRKEEGQRTPSVPTHVLAPAKSWLFHLALSPP
eukprot:5767649-Heterocapsa_arctica.AAC.1